MRDFMAQKRYKCFDCGIVLGYPGLCRSCTTYSDSGEVVNPVKRVRVDESGSEWKQSPNSGIAYSRDGLPVSRGFRKPKKLTKRQRKNQSEQFKQDKYWNAEIVNQMSDGVGEDGLIELGDSGGEEE